MYSGVVNVDVRIIKKIYLIELGSEGMKFVSLAQDTS
jgi:hypothetical protein